MKTDLPEPALKLTVRRLQGNVGTDFKRMNRHDGQEELPDAL
jgi:hypothetical protein